jgi:sarcosine oxidase delta subunit
MCPLCRVAHKADREYIWHFYDERSNDMGAVDEVRRAYGFCAEHIEMLRRIDVEDMKTTLSISVLLADTFAGIVNQLQDLSPDGSFETAQCPACASRDAYLHRNAEYLLDMLATSGGYRETFEASPGLCFPHFGLAWRLARTQGDRELLLSAQQRASESLLDDLREHVRKHDDRFRHEPKGPERDSWQHAIFLTTGWPSPSESAAHPEERG